MNLLSLRAYARHRGVTLRAVQKAIESGRIATVKDDKGRPKIDQAAADKSWQEMTDPAMQREKPAAAAPPSPAPEPTRQASSTRGDYPDDQDPDYSNDDPDDESGEEADGPGAVFARARAKKEKFKAELERLNYLKRAGELVEVEKVKSETFNLTRKTRDALLNVPSRIASELAAESDPVQIHNILTEAIVRALEELVSASGSK